MAEFNANDRIIRTLEDSKEQIKEMIGEINAICQERQIRKLLSKKDRDGIKEWAKLLEKAMDERLTVVVAGDFKRGKSSLINALVGKETATVNVSPETVTINKITYREEPGAEAVLVNGKRLRLFENELSREKLEQVMKDSPAEIDYIEIFRDNPFLQHITLVDTPGLGDGSHSYDKQVTDYLIHADIIIYVVSAMSPLSAEEQAFLNATVIPQNLAKMFLVVNMSDTLDCKEDVERVKNEIVKRTMAFNYNASVFAISALDEFCRKNDKRRPNKELADYLEQNYAAFEDALLDDCILQKNLIKTEHLVSLEKRAVADIRARVKKIQDVVALDTQKLEDMEQQLQEEQINLGGKIEKAQAFISAEVDEMKMEGRVWMHDYLERMRKEISALQNVSSGLELQRYLQFYISDKIKEGFQACIQAHAEQLKVMLEKQMETLVDDMALSSDTSVRAVYVGLADISWTNVDTAAFFINRYVSALGTVGYAIAGFLKQKKVEKSQKDLITPLLDEFDQIIKNVDEQVDEIYASYKKTAKEKVEESYRKYMEEALGNVAHAKQMRENQELQAEEMAECLEFVENALEKMEAMI